MTTGRKTDATPALQNIPLRTETGRDIRAAFTSRGVPFPAPDFSELELRVLASMGLSTERMIRYCFEDESLLEDEQ